MSPRSLLRALAAVVAVLLAAVALASCSTGSTDADDKPSSGSSVTGGVDADAFPVTIKHAFGETRIEKEPKRIVSIGSSDQDILLALGVVPVGIQKVTWGGNEQGTTPWFDAKLEELGGATPTLIDETDDIPVDEVAKLSPDLILATLSGITQEQYDKLSKIAPVVAFPGKPWMTTWQQSLELTGKAVGRSTAATDLEKQVDDEFAKAREDYPELQGKTFIWGALETSDLSQLYYYTPTDLRPVFLTSIGMKNAPIIEKISPKDAFYGQISAERASELDSDFFFTYAVKETDAKTFADDKLIGQIPAIKAGHMWASTDNIASNAAGVPTPLSVPYAIEHFVPKVAEAVAGK
ncbi:iron-siderophore ABC transporter substrate-binding protein [Nocardioides sp. Kera G14]|uniref:iron-siderophore ABC transporter substrate-binding protein n=1 Tax=Nocardioides sp. Kera G14 TaxID=2884264 RepID=UPI001D11D016|nr:iron-siderophore ABC transporter substrate-binding protein [Nocardioides sp. Kera G14]UDY23225.1 iron-siderophore ABC transporter substrate-binding protein [Nocardioides sp. Kera G14]